MQNKFINKWIKSLLYFGECQNVMKTIWMAINYKINDDLRLHLLFKKIFAISHNMQSILLNRTMNKSLYSAKRWNLLNHNELVNYVMNIASFNI